jgi:Bacterial membrane protein YfhO
VSTVDGDNLHSRHRTSDFFLAVRIPLLVTVCLLLVGGVIFGDFLFGEKLLLYKDVGADSVNDTYPTFVHLSDYIRNHGWPSWSFSAGMGQSLFHLTGDLILEPVVWLPHQLIAFALVYQHLLKSVVAGLFFFAYLRQRDLNFCASLLGALSLAFSAHMSMGSCWIISQDDTLCFAFLLFAIEKAIARGHWAWLPVAVAVAGLVTVFHLYLSAVLLCAYVPVRLAERDGWKPRPFALVCARLALLAVLGVGLGAIVFLGSSYLVLNSPRASGTIANFAFGPAPRSPFQPGSLLYSITALLRPFSNDLIGTGNAYRGWENYYEGPQLYCGLLPLLILPQVFVAATRRQRLIYAAVIALVIIPIIFPWFRYLFWLFQGGYFRTFALFSIFVVLALSMTALSRYIALGTVSLWTLGATLFVLLAILHCPVTEMQRLVNHELAWTATFFLFAYASFLVLGRMLNRQGLVGWIMVAIAALELIHFNRITVNRPTITKHELRARIGYNDETVDIVRDIRTTDAGFFRTTKSWGSVDATGPGYNDAMVFGYHGTLSYSPFNNLNYIKFLIGVDAIDPANVAGEAQSAPGLLCCPLLLSFACEKYVITSNPVSFQVAKEYEFVRRYNDIYLFRNNLSLPLGVVLTQSVAEDSFFQLASGDKAKALLQAVILPNKDAIDQSGLSTLSLEQLQQQISTTAPVVALMERRATALRMDLFRPAHISGTIQLDQNGILVFQMPFDAGWHSFIDGRKATTMKVDVGLLGILLKAGQHTVELIYHPPFLLAGAIVTLISCCIFAFSLWKWPRIRGLSGE